MLQYISYSRVHERKPMTTMQKDRAYRQLRKMPIAPRHLPYLFFFVVFKFFSGFQARLNQGSFRRTGT